jgi:DNA replication protein DnaC
VPHDHENFGKLVACPICGPKRQAEYQARAAERISRECGLGERQRLLTFEGFERYEGNERAMEAARRFADGGIEQGAWLVIQGKETGTGKTHLLAAIANVAIKRGVPTLYTYTTELLDHLRAGYRHEDSEGDDTGGFEERWGRVKAVRLLLIDDFGVQVEKPWVRERFEALFDARLREGLPTAITTNLVGDDWMRLSDRIRDRFDRYEPAAVVRMQALKYRVWKRQAEAGR